LRLQITRITPPRRTTLQCSQIFLTEVLTFIAVLLLVPVDDASAGEIVRRELHRDLVAGQYLDEMHAHLARDMGEYLVTVLELHTEHRVRQWLDHGALELDAFFFRQALSFVSSVRHRE